MATFSGSLDANVLLRLLLNDLPDQHAAVEALFQKTFGQLTVADTAIIEVVFVLERHYELSRQAIADAIEGIMLLTEIHCNHMLFEKALPLFTKNSALSFEDCCLVGYAELSDAKPLWTFDRKLANQASSAKLVPVA
jgi:predicted nucleic-acid-binding protein